jgi:hypothetical protein
MTTFTLTKLRRDASLGSGLEAYGLALRLRDRQRLDVTVALAFSLHSNAQLADCGTFDEFQQLLDWLRIPSDADQDSEVMAIAIPN